MTGRQLLLHPEAWMELGTTELTILKEYVERRGWKGLYHRDRRMYWLMRKAAERWVNEPPNHVERLKSLGYTSEKAAYVVQDLLEGHNPKCPKCRLFLDVISADEPWTDEKLMCPLCNGTYCTWEDVPVQATGKNKV